MCSLFYGDSFDGLHLSSGCAMVNSVTRREMINVLTYNVPYLGKSIELIALPHGKDYAISVMGGDQPHIGAVAVCTPGSHASVISVPNHKEDMLALDLANIICNSLRSTVSVSVGIHYDSISKSQIDDVIEIVTSLMDQFLAEAGSVIA